MIELLAIVVSLILFMLVIVWSHFLTQNRGRHSVDNSFRDQTNIDLYHEHKAEIEHDFKHGDIDDENHQYLLTELEHSLLQDIEENSAEAAKIKSLSKANEQPLSIVWPIVLSIFILLFSGYYYSQKGAYDLIVSTPQSTGSDQEISEQQQVKQQVQQLIELTKQEPKNSEAWYSLGQAFVGLGEFEFALTAFDKVIELDGEQADLYGAKAQAAYYQAEQKITPAVQQLVDKALSLDKKDPSTNILLGMHSFVSNEFEQAISYWQLVIDDARSSVNTQALQGAIDEAKNRLSFAGTAGDSALSGPQLSLNVSIGENILAELDQGEDKIVFIYATPSDGRRMPVAAVKVKASDLPLDVVFTDASAMTPQAKLSDVESVHLYAIISSTGGVGIKPGDFKAELKNVLVSETKAISLVIDSVVKETK